MHSTLCGIMRIRQFSLFRKEMRCVPTSCYKKLPPVGNTANCWLKSVADACSLPWDARIDANAVNLLHCEAAPGTSVDSPASAETGSRLETAALSDYGSLLANCGTSQGPCLHPPA